ncbi:MAG: S9 family peptidase, partial [Gammaproteobacteria bacterium]|nr:S9 family peptidase [Gammaproteobacteria bacterium]
YTRSRRDRDEDIWRSDVWISPTDGGEPLRMSGVGVDAGSPKWSPDNRYLGVLSGRGNGRTQVWLYDRRGGDAQQLTEFRQGVRSFEWSPDGTRMALIVMDPSPADLDEEPPLNPRPWVIDRLQFKRDYVGYLDNRHAHVHVIDVASRGTRQLTSGNYDHSQVTWSPDGKHIVFVSNRTAWPDSNRNTDLWRIDVSQDDPVPERLTTAEYADSDPVISPDGKIIAFRSAVSDGLPVYAIPQLSLLYLDSGDLRLVAALAEVQVWGMRFSADSRSLFAIAEYRGEQQLVRIDIESGSVERIIGGENTVLEYDFAPDGDAFATVSRPQSPAAIYRVDDGNLQMFRAINRQLMADVSTGIVEKHTFQSKDGQDIDTYIVFPPNYEEGRRYPAILHLHGGPWAQWDWRFDAESQLFAAEGYVVVMPNFRGSWGYGQAFSDALVGKWGEVDYEDSMAAVDFAIEKGWVDADRLAVYGWSWGGFLTNHVITKTRRFKAAISGASETLVVANYGHDEWQRLWSEDPGLPWLEENRETWDRVSPFWRLDKVTTPTLVVGGEDDWNMPILNSEQLYLVLRRRGIPTKLVVYPGQGHSLAVPSYERHLYEQYFAWLGRYVVE